MGIFNEPITLGSLTLKNRVFLAPLAGVSDVPFRRVCQEMGAGLTYVEMLSATAIHYRNRRTFDMMARHASESVLGVQITGGTPELVAAGISILDAQGFETIDINMGCPVRKVVSAGCGSAILREPERLSATVKMARQATQRPLSSKIRLGYTRQELNVCENVSRIILENADMVTIHGRTRSEAYSTPVDFEGIKAGVQTVLKYEKKDAPLVVGNGDIFCHKSALRMQAETQCNAIMVSRGALGNPWVFAEILSEKTTNPTFSEWLDLVLRHVSYHEEHYGNTKTSAILMRKHLLWYAKGFPLAKSLRESFNHVESLESARALLNAYKEKVPSGFVRYAPSTGVECESANSDYDPKYEMDRTLDRGVGDEGL